LSRWRDIKKGKVEKIPKETKESLNISPLHVRFKAFITDTFLIMMPIMYIVFYAIMGSREGFREHMLLGWIYILIPHMIIITLFLYLKNQTPGYKAYSIRLLTTDLKKPSLLQIIFRYILFTVSLFLIVPLFFPYFNKKRVMVHDIATKTVPIIEDE